MSAYCQHESGAAADHVGHHEHRHQVSERDSDETPGGKHLDCGFCHSACAVALTDCANSTVSVGLAVKAAFPPQLLSTAPATEPERPKWFNPA